MKSVWIIGGGRVGTMAARTFTERGHRPRFDITIVDKNSAACERLQRLPVRTVCMDGIDFLDRLSAEPGRPEWIIPAVPVHVAFRWAFRRLSELMKVKRLPVPAEVEKILPNTFRGSEGEIYTSNADFICPDNCPEPKGICSYTGLPREMDMFRRIEAIAIAPFRIAVVRSRQLLPGIGGYGPSDLFGVLEKIKNISGPVMLGTACRCHGVLHALETERLC